MSATLSTYNFWAKKTHQGNVLRLKQSIHQTNWAASIAHENTVNCVKEMKKGALMLRTLRNVRNTNSMSILLGKCP